MKHVFLIALGLLAAGNSGAELTVGPRSNGQCMLWEHRDMQGARMRLPHGDRVSFARADLGSSAWRESPTWNDVASSAKIDARCHLRVSEHMQGGGATKEWHGGSKGLLVKYMGDAWNDRASSATCYCD